MIKLDGLSAYYGLRRAVDNISLEVASGESLAIVGRNGSGKSSLLKAIAGDIVAEGRVTVEGGKELSKMSKRDRAKRVAFVEQTLPDAEMLVEDYVALGRIPHSGLLGLGMESREKDIVARVMSEVGIEPFAKRRVDQLSGGERQMCAIARALAQETEIILLDEPTASLDLANQMMVVELIGKMKGMGKTVVCVMHDINMAMGCCDRIMVMKEGGMTAIGKAGEEVTGEVLEEALGVGLELIEIKDRNMRIFVPRK